MNRIAKQFLKNEIKNDTKNNIKESIKEYSHIDFTKIEKKIEPIQNYFNNISLTKKILVYFITFSSLYIFTYPLYNLIISIIIAIFLFLLFFFEKKIYALIFIILYIIVITRITQEKKHSFGTPIYQTDINKNGKPYDCTSGPLIIQGNTLPSDQYGGYYTYSFWLYLNGNNNDINNGIDWSSYRYKEWKSIFYRGNPIDSNGDLSSLIQFPGFWLTPVLNNMVIVFQGTDFVERIEIDNIPFNTWVNFTTVLDMNSISVYVDGLLNRSLNLQQTSKIMNDYNLFIANDMMLSSENKGGYAGYLGELMCFNYALNPAQIYSSYLYYKKILDLYQFKIIKKNSNYKIPGLITNSDYF